LAQHIGDSQPASTRPDIAGNETAFDVRNPGAASPFLLIGDHAGGRIPRRLGDLGLPPVERLRHIGWDIGVAGLGAALADRLDATFIAQRFSRLVIDCNRDPSRPDAICEVSDGTRVPGNIGIDAAERQARVATVFAPYHARIAEELDARAALGRPTLVAALHSFTPVMAGTPRPWRYGVLHLGASPLSDSALAALRARLGPELVGDNQPYAMDGVDFTVPHHAIRRGLDYVELEVRQDLLVDAQGIDTAAALIGEVLAEVLADPPQPAVSGSST
jgi:predicted N-formylglutamate amidohydrolase